jgi:preprotein translocase subunit SecA
MEQVKQAYAVKASHESEESLKRLERHLILQAIDQHWQEYLRSMDSLRESIGLRAYGQRDPLVEYKREAYNLFMDLMERIYEEIANSLFRSATSVDAMQEFFKSLTGMQMPTPASALAATAQAPGQNTAPGTGLPPGMDHPGSAPAPRRETNKVGRNDPCPCGSGRKYKKCCGAE